MDGDEWHHVLNGMTLIVAVKPRCDGCRDFVSGDLDELSEVEVVVVSAVEDVEWQRVPRRVVVSPATMSELDIRSAPFYVLIDSARRLVVTEGTVFAPGQVATEISPFLAL